MAFGVPKGKRPVSRATSANRGLLSRLLGGRRNSAAAPVQRRAAPAPRPAGLAATTRRAARPERPDNGRRPGLWSWLPWRRPRKGNNRRLVEQEPTLGETRPVQPAAAKPPVGESWWRRLLQRNAPARPAAGHGPALDEAGAPPWQEAEVVSPVPESAPSQGSRLFKRAAKPRQEPAAAARPRPGYAREEGPSVASRGDAPVGRRGGGRAKAVKQGSVKLDRFGRPQGRLELVMAMFAFGFGMLGLRAVDLTTLQGDTLRGRAEEQHRAKVEVPAYRGRLLDRYGRTLAISLPVKSLSVDRDRMGEAGAMARKLAPILGLDIKELQDKLAAAPPRSFPVLKRKMPPGMSERVEALKDHSLFFTPEVERVYPMGEVVGHILGFVDIDGRGVEGLEKAFDRHLQGQSGVRLIHRDRLGRPMAEAATIRPARPGTDLILSIDATIQYVAYRALMKGVAKSNAKAGTAIVMDPNTGEVLALVNQPGFNPNDVRHSTPEARRNRALTDEYEPGSTFKVFTVAAALNEGLVRPDTVFDCENGRFYVKDRVIRDHHPHGRIPVREILQKSSNIGAAKIGLLTGNTVQEAYLTSFGFGQRTGIELSYETRGTIPDIFSYREVGLANRSFGQGVTVSPIQMASAMSAAVNGGRYLQPRMVAGQVIKGQRYQRVEPASEQVLRPEVSAQIREMLVGVTEAGGTGTQARVVGYSVAGKTGTAQKAGAGGYQDGKFYASFVGFAPAHKPRLVVFVGIDEPPGEHFGGQVAAPVFREIVEEALPLLTTLPDTAPPTELPPLRDTQQASAARLPEALKGMLAKGMVPRVHGIGRISSRETLAGGGVRLILQ